MKRNTLLDFVTQRADRESTAEFHRVLAEEAKRQTPEELKDIFRTLFKTDDINKIQKLYDTQEPMRDLVPKSGSVKFGEFLKKTKESGGKSLWDQAKKMFRGKDPLDMSPTDLENLFRVRHVGAEEGVWKIQMLPEYMAPELSKPQIKGAVAKFFNENKEFFSKADALEYDEATNVISFSGPQQKLDELLKALKVKDPERKSIVEQRQEMTGIFRLPLKVKGDGKQDKFNFQKYWQGMTQYQHQQGRWKGKLYPQALMQDIRLIAEKLKIDKDKIGFTTTNAENPDKETLTMDFTGTFPELAQILQNTLGYDAVKQVKDYLSEYKVGHV